jgi:hypothetical protein
MAQQNTIRELLTVVKLVAESKEGLRGLKMTESNVRAHMQRLKDMDKARSENLARVADKDKATHKKATSDLIRETDRQKRAAAQAAARAVTAARREADRVIALKQKVVAALERNEKRAVAAHRKAGFDKNRRTRKDHLKRIQIIMASARREEKAILSSLRRRARLQRAHRTRQIREERNFRKNILRLALGVGLPTTAGVGLAGMFVHDRILRGTADAADEAAITADRISFTTDQVQELKFASDIAGTKWGEVVTALRRMGDNAEDATRGAGMATVAFQEMGISVGELNGPLSDSMALLERIVKEFEGKSGRKLQGLSAQIFGRAGGKSLPLLNLGLDMITKLRKEADELGIVIGVGLTRSSQKFNDTVFRIQGAIAGIRNDIAKDLLPLVNEVAEAILAWWKANRKLIKQGTHKVFKAMAKGLGLVVKAFDRLDRIVRQVNVDGWAGEFEAAALWAGRLIVVMGAAAAVAAFAAWAAFFKFITNPLFLAKMARFAALSIAAAAPWILFAAAITGAALIFEDLMGQLRGEQGLLTGLFVGHGPSRQAVNNAQTRSTFGPGGPFPGLNQQSTGSRNAPPAGAQLTVNVNAQPGERAQDVANRTSRHLWNFGGR